MRHASIMAGLVAITECGACLGALASDRASRVTAVGLVPAFLCPCFGVVFELRFAALIMAVAHPSVRDVFVRLYPFFPEDWRGCAYSYSCVRCIGRQR